MEGYKLIVIDAQGVLHSLYDDTLAKLGGKQKITRASTVEPAATGSGWDVVLSDAPQNGKYRGHVVARNVPLRSEALQLEVDFIQTHILEKQHA